MGRYPTINPDVEYLDPRNPFYQDVIEASKALSKAEDRWYKRRLEVFKEYNDGSFSLTDGQIEADYDRVCGPDPWNYLIRFNQINPDRRPSSGGFRLVQNAFPLSAISEGYKTDIFVENGEDADGFCGGDRYVPPEDRKDDDCDDDPALRVLNYNQGRGKFNIDCLYSNLAAFKSNNNTTNTRYYVEPSDPDDPMELVDVYETFGEVPYAWQAKNGYSEQALSVLKAAGEDYTAEVRVPYVFAYDNALRDYNNKGGGNLNFVYLDGTIAEPWDGFNGKDVSYNKPGTLPGKLVRQVRGVPRASD